MQLSTEFEEILKQVRSADQICPKHDTPLWQLEGREPFCPQCVREKIHTEDRNRAAEAQKRHAERKRNVLHRDSLLDDETLTAATFDSYTATTRQEMDAKQRAQATASRYLAGETFNTVMTGAAGTGKSHLAMAILQQVNEQSEPARAVAFAGSGEILRKIRNSFNDKKSEDTEERVIARFAEPDLLVLDDLGSETGGIGTAKQASDFTQNVLYSLMNRRQGKSTIITTNLTGEQISSMYDAKLVSRLFRGSKGNTIKFSGINDKRLQLDF